MHRNTHTHTYSKVTKSWDLVGGSLAPRPCPRACTGRTLLPALCGFCLLFFFTIIDPGSVACLPEYNYIRPARSVHQSWPNLFSIKLAVIYIIRHACRTNPSVVFAGRGSSSDDFCRYIILVRLLLGFKWVLCVRHRDDEL